MRDRPLWFRLGLAFGGVSLAIVTLTLLGITLVQRQQQWDEARARAWYAAHEIAAGAFVEGVVLEDPRLAAIQIDRLVSDPGTLVGLEDASGNVVGPAGRVLPAIPPSPSPANLVQVTGGYVVVRAPVPSPGPVRGVVVARSAPGIARTLATGAPVALAVSLASFGLGAIVARRLTRPLDELRAVAARIGAGELDAQVAMRPSGELGSLADEVNAMSRSLAEARRREQEFLSNVSHELRTPITSVLGFAEALQDGTVTDPDGVARVAAIVHAEARRLERFADDVLTIARIGAGAFPIEIRDADARAVAEHAVEASRPMARQGAVELVVADGEALPVRTDPERLTQVLTNLLSNAIRVSDAGATVTVVTGESGAHDIWLEVRDEGPGIAPEDLPHVFERAYSRRARTGGEQEHGLGLAIVRELCNRLGATISVASTPGTGTVFTVLLSHASVRSEA